MRIECKAGTPNEMESKTCATEGQAKGFLRTRIARLEKWASTYNRTAATELAAVREETSTINTRLLPIGETRSWQVEDEVTGVKFRFEIKVLSK